jgi:uncharacterized protein YdaT|tara:strand:- start:3573 stop:3722 length:150 start_codon:yes stop_codon:yes gene_type:complete
MPLQKGTTQKVMWGNVKSLMSEGYKRNQAIAIAARKAGKKRGLKKTAKS